MNAADVMNSPIVAATLKASAREIALYMLLGGFSGVPILEKDGTLAGIVTEMDLLHTIREGKSLEDTTVDEIMTRDIVTVDVGTPVEDVMEVLESEKILRVPVMQAGTMVGIVSRPDLLRAAVEPQFERVG
ncbi:MAG: CBS domain-containing protein [Chloroflexi bacterium]|nr:CBS domain-containing protein [Chloroflexota bacterium]MCH8008573.1 CBS domain-containing protein [Chloroflexota bacterium]